MPHITVLGKEISELIAAGEVIERPSSVIKEVVENAIDAGAKNITVEIKNGGTTFMRIVDDGCGMAADEVPTAFLRHATSKISEKKDLDNIDTLGFRGEALASIAAVAKVTVLTKRKQDTFGTMYAIAAGVEEGPEQTGCPDGTTLLIRDLFFNVPVRQKFLKRDVTEANAVSQIVQKIAMSHPEISFRMIRDNRIEFRTDGRGDLYAAIYAICGKEFASDMIFVEYDDGVHQVKGYVGKPLYARANRSFQNFFINGRYVRSKQCSVALENAYQNLIMVGKFPTCVLMLQIPPSQVDVNIHPAKAEVRFSNEKAVMDALFFAVKNALLKNGLIYEFQMDRVVQHDWTTPVKQPDEFVQPFLEKLSGSVEESQVQMPSEFSLEKSVVKPLATQSAAAIRVPCSVEEDELPSSERELSYHPITETDYMPSTKETTEKYEFLNNQAFLMKTPANSVQMQEKQNDSKIRVIGEVFENYILAEVIGEDQIVIFDKHAAHERVLFEQLKTGESKQTSQMLLRPSETLVSMEEFSAVQENLSQLEEMGFTFDCSRPPKLLALAVPSFVLQLNVDEVVSELAHNLMLGKRDPQTHTFQDILHSMACKAAIRSGDHTDLLELQKLAEEVWKNQVIRHCPHGRPVMFVIGKSDLEKQFRRT